MVSDQFLTQLLVSRVPGKGGAAGCRRRRRKSGRAPFRWALGLCQASQAREARRFVQFVQLRDPAPRRQPRFWRAKLGQVGPSWGQFGAILGPSWDQVGAKLG